jgi:hypothetical protein
MRPRTGPQRFVYTLGNTPAAPHHSEFWRENARRAKVAPSDGEAMR